MLGFFFFCFVVVDGVEFPFECITDVGAKKFETVMDMRLTLKCGLRLKSILDGLNYRC